MAARRRGALAAAFAGTLAIAALATPGAARASEPQGELLIPRGSAPPCGQVLLPGSAWLSGSGVDVHSNGATQGGRSCAGFSVANLAVQYGGGWQCIELAARLYYVKGWGTVYAAGNGGARYIPEGSPELEFHPNGSGYTPVQGDLVVEAFGTYGHNSIVERVAGNVIYAIEQNAALTARHNYPWSNGVATGAYNNGVVRGFMHSPRNNALPGASSAKPRIARTVARVTRRVIVLRWTSADPGSVNRFKVQLKRRDVRNGRWSPGVTLGSSARRFRVEITQGKVYRLRVAARNRSGRGPWNKTGPLRP